MRSSAPAAVLLVVALVPAGAHAAPPWSPPATVSRVPGTPSAAVGPDGRAALAWSTRNTAYGARRTASGRSFGAPFAFRKQRNLISDSVVTYDAAGSALFAHRRFLQGAHRMESAALRPSGSRTSPITLSGPGSSAYGASTTGGRTERVPFSAGPAPSARSRRCRAPTTARSIRGSWSIPRAPPGSRSPRPPRATTACSAATDR